MGWGEEHRPSNGGTGTTGQIELANEALDRLGVEPGPLALRVLALVGRPERPAMDLPYEEVPDGPIPLSIAGADIAWGDHLHARAAVVGGDAFGQHLNVRFPTVIFTFEIGNPRGPARPVAEVAFVGTPVVLRKLGTVLRDTCNGAANAAERTA